jgi:apolipoprotein N-acyltransferase
VTNFFFTSSSFAGEIFGYPVAPTQLRFHILILGLIGVSVAIVSVAYLSFWVMDLKKKREKVRELMIIKKQAFAGELVAAAQPAE